MLVFWSIERVLSASPTSLPSKILSPSATLRGLSPTQNKSAMSLIIAAQTVKTRKAVKDGLRRYVTKNKKIFF